jgi:hypothetical protein
MSRKLLAILIVSLFSACAFPVGASADMSTSNQYVAAIVSDGWGLVTWYKKPTAISLQKDWKVLSFVNHSFLNLRINSLYYTNNNLTPPPPKIGPPEVDTKLNPDVFLDNGTNTKIGDTIETTWRQGAFDIVQDVYPVQFSHSGQIVMKIRIVNHSTSGIAPAEAEFLLDIDPQNDKAKVLTRYGYSPKWRLFPDLSNGVPPFFVAFERAPDDSRGGFPGLTGTAYVTNEMTPTPMELVAPSKLIIGAWTDLSYYKWGYPDSRVGQDYDDNAALYQWPPTSCPGKTTIDSSTTIATLSYGTGEFCENFGANVPVFAMLMRPGQLQYDARSRQYAPNPFKVEALIFNLSATNSLSNVLTALTVQAPLRFTVGSKLTQTVKTNPAAISSFSVGDTSWMVKVVDTNNTYDILANLSLDVNGIGWTDPWDCPIRIPPVNTDSFPPILTVESSTKDSIALKVHDDRLLDLGMKSITWTDSNVTVLVTGGSMPISGCSQSIYNIRLAKKDTTLLGYISFLFTDCANNTTGFSAYFPAGEPLTPDVSPPTFTYRFGSKLNHGADSNNRCNFQCTEWSLLDNKQFDRGLASVTQKQFDNMSLNIDGLSPDGKAVSFSVCAVDTMKNGSMTIQATDSAGHVVDTSFTYCAAATAGVGSSALSDLALRVYPNPTAGACTLTLNGTATIEVLDVLGRTVDRFTMTDMREWDMSALPAGTYIVRAEITDAHVSTRILKQ